MLPRRHFKTASSTVTTDIVRTRDLFNTKILDDNDVAGATVVKSVIDTQHTIESRLDVLEANNSSTIGTYTEFETEFNLNK